MPSRKQRRRRQKERRHEYEVVYVDEEGRELQEPPAESAPDRGAKRDGRGQNGKAGRAAKTKGARAAREYQPPSWNRSLRRAALFFPLFFIVFSLVNKKAAIEARLVASLGYSALFVPLTYLMDRAAYRSFLRRSGRDPQGR